MNEILSTFQIIVQLAMLVIVLALSVTALIVVQLLFRHLQDTLADIKATLDKPRTLLTMTTSTPATSATPAPDPILWRASGVGQNLVSCPHCDEHFYGDPVNGKVEGEKTVMTYICRHCQKKFQIEAG